MFLIQKFLNSKTYKICSEHFPAGTPTTRVYDNVAACCCCAQQRFILFIRLFSISKNYLLCMLIKLTRRRYWWNYTGVIQKWNAVTTYISIRISMAIEPNENENINVYNVSINKMRLPLPSGLPNKTDLVIISPIQVYFTVLYFWQNRRNRAEWRHFVGC